MEKPLYRFVDITPNLPEDTISLSPVLAEVMARTVVQQQVPAVLIRRHHPYILLGPKDRRLPYLDAGVKWLQSQGYAVFMRVGGGSAVLLDQGCLSFGVARPCRDFTMWEKNFREMAQGVILGLRHLGVSSQFGRAVGSYCEGPFDLVSSGQKISGIAQAIRGGYALVSGMLLVNQDPIRTTALLQEFYVRAGSDIRLDARAVTSLNLAAGRDLSLEQVHDALLAGFQECYTLAPQPLTDAEINLARQLYQERQLNNPKEASYASGH